MRLVLTAGGTGGHITPAIAFGRWRNSLGDQVLYVCGSRPLEREIYSHHGIKPKILHIDGSPLGTDNLLKRISRSWHMISSFFSMYWSLKKKRPDAAVLFGGYVSLPALLACKLLSIPTVVHEQNAVAGKVTRLAEKMGFPIAQGWSRCDGIKSGVFTGTPIRPIKSMKREEALRKLGLKQDVLESKIMIFVLGGSLGSSPLIPAVLSASSMVKSAGCVYICLGSSETVSTIEGGFIGLPPCWDMSSVYALSDMIICRAGGATLAEMAFYRIPALVVPWKKASDGHQEANARCFMDSGAAGALWSEDQGADNLAEKIDNLLETIKTRNSSGLYSDDGALALLWQLVLSHGLKGESGFGSYKG